MRWEGILVTRSLPLHGSVLPIVDVLLLYFVIESVLVEDIMHSALL